MTIRCNFLGLARPPLQLAADFLAQSPAKASADFAIPAILAEGAVEPAEGKTHQDEGPGDQANPAFERHASPFNAQTRRVYDFFSDFEPSSSVLDEHPVETPHVGSPAFRIRNRMTNQIPTISTNVPIPPRPSMVVSFRYENAVRRSLLCDAL